MGVAGIESLIVECGTLVLSVILKGMHHSSGEA